jgi:signal transduction histidine kinase
MRARAAAIGARFAVVSGPGRGTSLELVLRA